MGLCPALGRMSWMQLEGLGVAKERILELGVVPSAVNLARLVRIPEAFDAQALFALEPHYVRASAAELNPKFPAPAGPAPTTTTTCCSV